jgi:hypothetical protein
MDVVKGEDVLVLIDLTAGQFAAKDASEDIVAVVSHAGSGAALLRSPSREQ